MPTVHNGIGTWYYGRQRIHSRKGNCEFCGSMANLQSYDTTLFFVFFMVPLIPLARKRILEECASCRQHRVMPLKQWDEGKVTQGMEVLEKLRTDPNNRESLLQAMVFAQAYQDEPLFDQLVAPLAKERLDDAAVQAHLADGYTYFARWPQAEQAYRASLAIEDNEALRERLGWALLKQGRPQEALPFMRHILDQKTGASAGTIYYLILGYQAEGLHDEALALMDRRDEAFPEFAGDKEYEKQRKLSTRHRDSQKKIRSALLDEGKSGYQSGNWTAQLPRWIGGVLFLGAVAFYLGSALWIGQARRVFLVNGTKQPYSVSIAGVEHRLPPGPTPVRIAEGDIDVAFADAKLGLEPFRCQLETSFWSRPFVSPTFVINPDQVAVIFEEETWYAANAPPPGAPPQFHMGKGLYTFSGLDYEFQEFPQTLQVKGSQTIRKTRVALVPGLTQEESLHLMLQHVPAQEQVDYCKRLLRLEPNNMLLLSWLATRLSTESMLDFLKSHLDDRPVQVDWHRMFQALMEKKHPETDLIPRYQKIVDETGGHPDAVYLLGRIVPDFDKSQEMIRQAAGAASPSGYALNSLGFRALSQGHFAEAVTWFEKALPLLADKSYVRRYYQDALWGKGDYDRILQELNTPANLLGTDLPAAMQVIRVHAARGDKDKARAALAESLQTIPTNARPSLQRVLEGWISCCEYDVAGFLKAAPDAGPTTFELAFLRENLEEAGTLAKKANHDADIYHALVYLAASRAGAKELAATHWEALLSQLRQGHRDERHLEELLAGRKTLAQRPVEHLLLDPRSKRVFMAVLAERHPDQAKSLLALARTLDFHRDVISLCLRKALATKGERPG